MSLLDLTTETQGDGVRIVLTGELDISTAPRVEEELRRVEEGRPAVILLDLRALEFMDSTGLRVIVSADGRAREEDRNLRLVRGPEAVQRIFRVTRLDERLEIADDPDVQERDATPAAGRRRCRGGRPPTAAAPRAPAPARTA